MTATASEGDRARWLAGLEKNRERWEALYRGGDSPLSPEARKAFAGLRWFPPAPDFRLRGVRLERYPEPRPASLAATGEDALTFVEVGTLAFDLKGTACTLLAFEPAPGEVEPDDNYVFVPFRDATSGKETYGGGRYIDLDPAPGDVYELDFNRAYHPYCVFDENWACTIPPLANRLPVRVEAGARL